MKLLTFVCTIAWLATLAFGQTSSLYVSSPATQPAPQALGPRGEPNRLSPDIARASYSAVLMPEPRQFAVHDLVTIVVRESTETDSDSKLETSKDASVDGEVSAMPELALGGILLRGGDLVEPPKVGMKFKNEFSGDGNYSRKDSFTTRITARIIDVKPNGTLVLEARKFIKSDKETLDMILTGTCRKEDISTDNTVLSTQLYDMRLVKEHKGELKEGASKGILTKVFDYLFNF